MYNVMCDVAFTVIDKHNTIERMNKESILNAMQKRLDYLKANPNEINEAIGVCDSYKQ